MKPVGVFGGTFDPIHYGHLRTAFELLEGLELEQVRFIPAARPPHRDAPGADAELRLAMVRAATEAQPGFVVDDRELRRAGPSYTVLTLAELRAELGARPICLVVGMDAFAGLPSWHRWQELLELAHLVVAHRPGWNAPESGQVGELLQARRADRVAELHDSPAGRILVRPVTQLEISSTRLRGIVASGRDLRYLVPEPVRAIINETACYTRQGMR
jgi:nicotinate-nucleotide adenylyltransferase